MSDQSSIPQEGFDILIEWPDQEGLVKASLEDSIKELKMESQKAINLAMGVIRTMANSVSQTLEEIDDKSRPDEMEVEFSLKLDLEGGVVVPLIAKTTTGGQFNIKFKWTLERPKRGNVIVR